MEIKYADSIFITSDSNGIVLTFGCLSEDKKPMVVSRIGISKDYAKEFVKYLRKVLKRVKV